MKLMTRAAAVAVVVAVATMFGPASAEAKLFKSAKAAAAEAAAKAEAAAALAAATETIPAGPVMTVLPASNTTVFAANATPCCQPCCPVPCISYRNAIFDFCKVRCCDPCAPPVKAVLHVKNPCTCCPAEVPVCLPSCCCGEPTVCCKPTLLGSGKITYTWCCGVSVDIRFDRCGDIKVVYRGT